MSTEAGRRGGGEARFSTDLFCVVSEEKTACPGAPPNGTGRRFPLKSRPERQLNGFSQTRKLLTPKRSRAKLDHCRERRSPDEAALPLQRRHTPRRRTRELRLWGREARGFAESDPAAMFGMGEGPEQARRYRSAVNPAEDRRAEEEANAADDDNLHEPIRHVCPLLAKTARRYIRARAACQRRPLRAAPAQKIRRRSRLGKASAIGRPTFSRRKRRRA